MNYDELVAELRKMQSVEYCAIASTESFPAIKIVDEAADAIEELLHAAKKMHLWIFLNTGDEQKAYDECGLSDEMNAMLGYGGQFELRAEPPKEERKDPCADCVHYPPSSTDGKPCCACDPANPLTNCHETRENA